MTKSILELVKSMLHACFTSFDGLCADACNVLTGNTVTSVWGTAVYWSRAVKPFCNVIIGICLLIEFAQVASKVDIIKWEHGIKIGVKMCLAKVAIDTAPDFLLACYRQVVAFITYLAHQGSSISIGGTLNASIDTYIDGVKGLGSALGLLVSVLIVQIGIKVCGIMIVVMAYGRIFEILVYVVVSPIPMAFFPLGMGRDDISRISTRFLKNFIAVCLQGLMMFVAIRIFGLVIGNALSTQITNTLGQVSDKATIVSELCYDMILYTIVLVMAVAKCGSWAKSLIDAS